MLRTENRKEESIEYGFYLVHTSAYLVQKHQRECGLVLINSRFVLPVSLLAQHR